MEPNSHRNIEVGGKTGQDQAIHAAIFALFIAAGVAASTAPASAAGTPQDPNRSVQHFNNPADAAGGREHRRPQSVVAAKMAAQLAGLDRKIAGYRAKLRKSPKLWPVWAELGGAYRKKARLRGSRADQRDAERALKRSLTIQPNFAAWRWLASVRLDQHRFPEAAALARQAAEAFPGDAMSRAVWSDALLAMGRYDEARAVFDGQSPSFYAIAARSRLLFLRGKPEAAIAQLRKALYILGPDSSESAIQAKAWCHLMIGGYHYELDQPSKAKEAYSRALALDPGRIDVREHLAEWEARYGGKETAVSIYRDIISANPRPKEKIALGVLLVDIGLSMEGKSLISEAIDSWRRRLELGDVSVRRELALALLDHGGEAQEGLRLARDDLKLRQDALAYDTLAWALYKAGALDKAKGALSRALTFRTPYRVLREHAKSIGQP